MAKNFVQLGDTLTFTAPSGGVAAGVPKIIGDLFVIPLVTAAQNKPFAGKLDGAWELPKVSAQAWTQGAVLYWDAAAGLATTVATGNRRIGAAGRAAANPSALGVVRLDAKSLGAAGV